VKPPRVLSLVLAHLPRMTHQQLDRLISQAAAEKARRYTERRGVDRRRAVRFLQPDRRLFV
jgi:hypothetical protein